MNNLYKIKNPSEGTKNMIRAREEWLKKFGPKSLLKKIEEAKRLA